MHRGPQFRHRRPPLLYRCLLRRERMNGGGTVESTALCAAGRRWQLAVVQAPPSLFAAVNNANSPAVIKYELCVRALICHLRINFFVPMPHGGAWCLVQRCLVQRAGATVDDTSTATAAVARHGRCPPAPQPPRIRSSATGEPRAAAAPRLAATTSHASSSCRAGAAGHSEAPPQTPQPPPPR